MALNYIQVFDDTVVKLSINLGLENQRDTKTLGSFTVGELAFTRDSGRVFVGDFTDDNHLNHLETIGGILVGNRYLGSIDSKSLESFNSDPSVEVKTLNFTESTTPDNTAKLLNVSENGVIYAGSKFKLESLGFDASKTLTEENWSRWNRYNTYNDKYDAYNGDYLYDKFQNALVIFDNSIKETSKNNEYVRAGWLHNTYGPSFNVWLDKNEVSGLTENSTIAEIEAYNYDNVTSVYPFRTQDTESNKWYACDSTGNLLRNDGGESIEVLSFRNIASKSLVSFFKRSEDKTSTSRNQTDITKWNGLWVIDKDVSFNDGLVKIKGDGEEDTEIIQPSDTSSNDNACTKIAIYLDEDGQPFENQEESSKRTILTNRDTEGYSVYGDGYVIFRNVEPDGKYLKFEKRRGYIPRIGNDSEGAAKIDFEELTTSNSNIITIEKLPVKSVYERFKEDDFDLIGDEDEALVSLKENLLINSINTTSTLKLPTNLTFSTELDGLNRGSESTTGLNLTIDYLTEVNDDSHMISLTKNNEVENTYTARVTPYSHLPIIVNLGDGLIGERGNKLVKCYVLGGTDDEAITLESNNTGLISDEYGFQMVYNGLYTRSEGDEEADEADIYTHDGTVYYVGSLVVTDKGLVIDSDKFYNGDNILISEKYKEHNTPINFLKNPKPIFWTYDDGVTIDVLGGVDIPALEQTNFLTKFIISDSKLFCQKRIVNNEEELAGNRRALYGLGWTATPYYDNFYPLLRGRVVREKALNNQSTSQTEGEYTDDQTVESLGDKYIEVSALLSLSLRKESKNESGEGPLIFYDVPLHFKGAKTKDITIQYNGLEYQHVKSITLRGKEENGDEFLHTLLDNRFERSSSTRNEVITYSYNSSIISGIEKFRLILSRTTVSAEQESSVTLYDLEFICGDNCRFKKNGEEIRYISLNDNCLVSHIIIETYNVESSIKYDSTEDEFYYLVLEDSEDNTAPDVEETTLRFGVSIKTNSMFNKPDNGYLYYEWTKEENDYPNFNMVARDENDTWLAIQLDECEPEDIEKYYVSGVLVNAESTSLYEKHLFEILDDNETTHLCMKLNLVETEGGSKAKVVTAIYEDGGKTYTCDPLIWFNSTTKLEVVSPQAEEVNAFIDIPEHARSVILEVDAKFTDTDTEAILSTSKRLYENPFMESRSSNKRFYNYGNTSCLNPPSLNNIDDDRTIDFNDDETVLLGIHNNSINVIEVPLHIDELGNKYFTLIGRDIPVGNSDSEQQREFVINYIGYRA